MPTLAGESPVERVVQRPAPPAPKVMPRPVIKKTQPPVRRADNSGTFIGSKVLDLRRELLRLQGNVQKNNGDLQKLRANGIQSADRYQRAVADVNSRLQVGTTPGNPVLVQKYNNALSLLNKITEDISTMNKLASRITSDSTLAAFLSENTRAAFRVSGAMDEDHQNLAMLEDEVNRTVVLVERLLKELSEDIQRHTNFVATERSNLNTLSASIKTGEIMGASLTNRALDAATSNRLNRPMARITPPAGSRPLVIIRFDRKDVAYEQALYNAVSRALERRPSATFSLVAVAPNIGGAARVALSRNKARRNAEGVLRALQRMGLPPQRVSLSERTGRATNTEIHLYLN